MIDDSRRSFLRPERKPVRKWFSSADLRLSGDSVIAFYYANISLTRLDHIRFLFFF